MRRQLAAVAMLFTAILSPAADAAIVDSNDSSLASYQSADGMNITTDTRTGLDWLDIDTTNSKSFNAMSALLGVGELADFRYATLGEVDTYFNNLGLPTRPLSAGALTSPDPGGVLFTAARSHTGLTFGTGGLSSHAWGLTSTPGQPDMVTGGYFQLVDVDAFATVNFSAPVTTGDFLVGSWIVRGTVPEPSTLAMFSLFVMIGGFIAWRKRKRA